MEFSFGSFLAGATIALISWMCIAGLARKQNRCDTCGFTAGCKVVGAAEECKQNNYKHWEPKRVGNY